MGLRKRTGEQLIEDLAAFRTPIDVITEIHKLDLEIGWSTADVGRDHLVHAAEQIASPVNVADRVSPGSRFHGRLFARVVRTTPGKNVH